MTNAESDDYRENPVVRAGKKKKHCPGLLCLFLSKNRIKKTTGPPHGIMKKPRPKEPTQPLEIE